MIPNEEKEVRKGKSEGRRHYLAIKKLSALLGRITSKKGDFYCLNCLHSFRTENKLKYHENVLCKTKDFCGLCKVLCKNKDFCGYVMPSEKDKILEFNQYIKADKCHILFMLKLNL